MTLQCHYNDDDFLGATAPVCPRVLTPLWTPAFLSFAGAIDIPIVTWLFLIIEFTKVRGRLNDYSSPWNVQNANKRTYVRSYHVRRYFDQWRIPVPTASPINNKLISNNLVYITRRRRPHSASKLFHGVQGLVLWAWQWARDEPIQSRKTCNAIY